MDNKDTCFENLSCGSHNSNHTLDNWDNLDKDKADDQIKMIFKEVDFSHVPQDRKLYNLDGNKIEDYSDLKNLPCFTAQALRFGTKHIQT